MHLLDVNTFELVERGKLTRSASYAILSHRWVDEDKNVDFQKFEPLGEDVMRDLRAVEARKAAEARKVVEERKNLVAKLSSPQTGSYGIDKGLAKVAWACRKARGDNIPYIWIDTCCIDKRPGADIRQVSIALTSMFRWYRDAQVCYTYLQDVTTDKNEFQQGGYRPFEQSEWFTRGWTLQELLAPHDLRFFDHDWRFMGTKRDRSNQIQEATNIERKHLDGDLTGACIAVKMSWLSGRTTTLREDMAYCMLGVFGVPMDVQYGRGEKEFLRLQEILIERFDDESIFAWADSDMSTQLGSGNPQQQQGQPPPSTSGLLAPWPSLFQHSSHLTVDNEKLYRPRQEGGHKAEKDGIMFPLPMKLPDHGNGVEWNTLLANRMINYNLGLNCWAGGQEKQGNVTLRLQRDQGRQWRRANVKMLEFDKGSLKRSSLMLVSKTRPALIPHKTRAEDGADWASVLADRTAHQIAKKLATWETSTRPRSPSFPLTLEKSKSKSSAGSQPIPSFATPSPSDAPLVHPRLTPSKTQEARPMSIRRKPVLPPRPSTSSSKEAKTFFANDIPNVEAEEDQPTSLLRHSTTEMDRSFIAEVSPLTASTLSGSSSKTSVSLSSKPPAPTVLASEPLQTWKLMSFAEFRRLGF
ncbi:MAG: hypothetical protein LQ352_005058 [Teloschistes flavicans]|nr:MAG: hypothetical protein LQ352_005058 [Teloschistes flavicans]